MSISEPVTGSSGQRLRPVLFTVAVVLVILALLVSGCSFPLPYRHHLVGPYYVTAVEDRETLGVGYDGNGSGLSFERIPAVVIDVGWDNRYVVASRRPPGKPGGELTYYYIDMAKDGRGGTPEGAVMGPLTEQEFKTTKGALGLPEFTLHYPEMR